MPKGRWRIYRGAVPLDCSSPTSFSRAAQLISSWRDVPACIVDRHLTVLPANPLLRLAEIASRQ